MNHLISTIKPNHSTVRIGGLVLAMLFLLAIAIAVGAGTVAADQHAPAFDLADYATEEGVVETEGLREAVADWRADDSMTTADLRAVIDAWRSGVPVNEPPVDEPTPVSDDGADGESIATPPNLSIDIVGVSFQNEAVVATVQVRNAGGETDTRVGISSVTSNGEQILQNAKPIDRKIATDGGFQTTVSGTLTELQLSSFNGYNYPSQSYTVTVGAGSDLTSPDDTDTWSEYYHGCSEGFMYETYDCR